MPSASVNSPSIVPPAPVGFIGLGKMGHPMARRLSGAGYRIVAHDLDPNALNRAREAIGAEVPGSLKAMASRCEAVITMLPDGNAVRAVVLGPNGAEDCLLAGFRRGGVLIAMSSSSPLGTRALGARLAERGVAMLDAPVSGGVRKAADATLSIMAGGDAPSTPPPPPHPPAVGRQSFPTRPPPFPHAGEALTNHISPAR